jgi:hypothetical protein
MALTNLINKEAVNISAVSVKSLAALAARKITKATSVYLELGGRSGNFNHDPTVSAGTIALDNLQGINVASPFGGAWVRDLQGKRASPDMFGAPKDGTDDVSYFVAAQKVMGNVTLSVHGTYTILSQSAEMDRIKLIGDDATINGYDGTGFLVAGEIYLQGQIKFVGFETSASREAQATNYLTTAIRIKTGSTLDFLRVGKDIHFNQCRGGIRACLDTNDFTGDTSIRVNGKSYFYASSFQTICALKLRCVYQDLELAKGKHKQAIGAGRIVTPIDCFLDGIANASPFYEECKNIHIHHLIFDTVINRTTTGDSTTGNNYECHGFMLSGKSIQIDNIIGSDVTGVNFDCELIYIKARHWTINQIVATNCGAQEGCINIKGVGEQNTVSTSPFGGSGTIANVFIKFDNYVFDNNGTSVNLNRTGIQIAAPYNVIFDSNIVVTGANAGDVIVNGLFDSDNAGVSGKITSRGNIGSFSLRVRGQVKYATFVVDCADAAPTGDFYCIDLLNVDRRGNFGDYDISGTSLKMTTTSTGIICLLRVKGENEIVRSIVANNCIWGVDAPNADVRPIYLTAQSAAATGYIEKLTAKDWTIINNNFSTPINVGSYEALNYDAKFSYTVTTLNNVNTNVGNFHVPTGKNLKLEVNFTAYYIDDRTKMYSSSFKGHFRESGGAAIEIAQVETNNLSNTTAISGILNVNAQQARAQVNGGTGEEYLWHVECSVTAR